VNPEFIQALHHVFVVIDALGQSERIPFLSEVSRECPYLKVMLARLMVGLCFDRSEKFLVDRSDSKLKKFIFQDEQHLQDFGDM